MRQIREVLRLKFEQGYCDRQAALACQLRRPAVRRYVERATAAGLSWPLPAELYDVSLERRLFPPLPSAGPSRPLPNYREVHLALRHKGVTLMLLWGNTKRCIRTGCSTASIVSSTGGGHASST